MNMRTVVWWCGVVRSVGTWLPRHARWVVTVVVGTFWEAAVRQRRALLQVLQTDQGRQTMSSHRRRKIALNCPAASMGWRLGQADGVHAIEPPDPGMEIPFARVPNVPQDPCGVHRTTEDDAVNLLSVEFRYTPREHLRSAHSECEVN
jgi:hypothetical protein